MIGRDGHTLGKLRALVHDEEGQNLVEFALLLPILLYILMGIIQFGLIFAVYVTINNSVREAARWGSIYIYDISLNSPTNNDTARNNGMVDRIYYSRGILSMAPRGGSTVSFSTANTGSAVGKCPVQTPAPVLGWWYGDSLYPDVTICYSIPAGVTANDPRRGYYLDVQAWYHLQVFIPLLQQFLPDDPSKPDNASWIRLPGRITVVVN